MGLFLVWCHRLICKHACKEVCDVNPGIDPHPLLTRSCDRWWPDFVTFTACKKSRFGLKRGKKVQCVLNEWKDLFEWKTYFGVWCTLKKSFWHLLEWSASTGPGASVIPFRVRVFSQNNMTGNNVLFYNWYFLGVKEISSHAHKPESCYLLGILLDVSDEHPCPFDMEVFPQGTSCNDH